MCVVCRICYTLLRCLLAVIAIDSKPPLNTYHIHTHTQHTQTARASVSGNARECELHRVSRKLLFSESVNAFPLFTHKDGMNGEKEYACFSSVIHVNCLPQATDRLNTSFDLSCLACTQRRQWQRRRIDFSISLNFYYILFDGFHPSSSPALPV